LAALVLVTVAPVVGFEVLYRVSLSNAEPLPTLPIRARLPSPLREAMIAAEGNGCTSSAIYPWNHLPLLFRRPPPLGHRPHGDGCVAVLVAKSHLLAVGQERALRRLQRQLTEAALAIWLRRHWEPEQVLTKYAETAYYGHRLNSCDATAQALLGHDVESLSASEAALIAGLLQSPSKFSPWTHPQAALARRQFVLERMHTQGALDDAQLAAALAAPLGTPALPAPVKPSANDPAIAGAADPE
jgi:hypothetical protein